MNLPVRIQEWGTPHPPPPTKMNKAVDPGLKGKGDLITLYKPPAALE